MIDKDRTEELIVKSSLLWWQYQRASLLAKNINMHFVLIKKTFISKLKGKNGFEIFFVCGHWKPSAQRHSMGEVLAWLGLEEQICFWQGFYTEVIWPWPLI